MKTPRKSNKALDDPLEKVIEKKVCDYAKEKYGVLSRKYTSPQHRNVPDRLLLWPGGHTLFIEFKRRGRVPTPGQEREIKKLVDLGHKVLVIDEIEYGRTLIDAVARGFKA